MTHRTRHTDPTTNKTYVAQMHYNNIKHFSSLLRISVAQNFQSLRVGTVSQPISELINTDESPFLTEEQ